MNRTFIRYAVLLGLTVSGFAVNAEAQRDYFTSKEVDIIREAQDIDVRIKVLTHTIDRRLGVLKLGGETAAEDPKAAEKWGPLPSGSRTQLLSDIKRILQKAVDDIDDRAAHAGGAMERSVENPNKKDKADPPLSRALRELGTAAKRFKPLFQAELDAQTDRSNAGPLLDAIALCDQILEAAAKPIITPAKN